MNEKKKPYHHGDLREALLTEALGQLRQSGIESLSLRACSKAVGVSPGAAFRHFKDKRALATALAAIGFGKMGDRIAERQTLAGQNDMLQFRAVGEGYVAFALEEPNLFFLMFAPNQIDAEDAALEAASRRVPMFSTKYETALQTGDMLAWGLVHGLATLAITGNFSNALPSGTDAQVEALTEVMSAMGPAFRALQT